MKLTKNSVILAILALLIVSSFSIRKYVVRNLSVPVVLADDDEEDDDEDEHRKTKTTTETTYKTVYVKLPDTVIEKIIQVPLHDSDSDGIYDDEDPYPYINKFFVVEDKNLNGIDDEYEKLIK